MAGLPVGYRFKPSKTQLIGYFLTTKLNGQQLPSHYPFLEIDVYSNHPFKILASKENEDGFMEGYFFTPLKKTTAKGKRASRVIEGQGTWSGKSKVTDVYDETMTNVIGFERYYKFEPVEGRKNAPENEFEWKMHEYALMGDNNEIVLCHITNKLGNGDGCRSSSKRVRNYDIMDSNFKASTSKRSRIECNSSNINPTQQYTTPQGFQDQRYNTMPNGFQHQQYDQDEQCIVPQEDGLLNQYQQYTTPLENGHHHDQPYTMPQGFQDQEYHTMHYSFQDRQYTTPLGDGLLHHDLQNNMQAPQEDDQGSGYGLEETSKEALTSELCVVDEGGLECNNDVQGVLTSLNYSYSEFNNDNMNEVDVGHSSSKPSCNNNEDGLEKDGETSDRALMDELEGMLMSVDVSEDGLDNDGYYEALAKELEGLMSDEDEDEDNSNKAVEDETHNYEQVEEQGSSIHELDQQVFAMSTNGAHDDATRFQYPSTRCDYNTNNFGFEHQGNPNDLFT